jgi:hypothetical protein
MPEGPEDLEGFVLEKTYLYDKILQFLEKIYILFIKERLSPRWSSAVVPGMKKWMAST